MDNFYTSKSAIEKDYQYKHLAPELAVAIRKGAGGLNLEECLYCYYEHLPITSEALEEAKSIHRQFRLQAKHFAMNCLKEHNPAIYLEILSGRDPSSFELKQTDFILKDMEPKTKLRLVK